jgi:hypothetical protein
VSARTKTDRIAEGLLRDWHATKVAVVETKTHLKCAALFPPGTSFAFLSLTQRWLGGRGLFSTLSFVDIYPVIHWRHRI